MYLSSVYNVLVYHQGCALYAHCCIFLQVSLSTRLDTGVKARGSIYSHALCYLQSRSAAIIIILFLGQQRLEALILICLFAYYLPVSVSRPAAVSPTRDARCMILSLIHAVGVCA